MQNAFQSASSRPIHHRKVLVLVLKKVLITSLDFSVDGLRHVKGVTVMFIVG